MKELSEIPFQPCDYSPKTPQEKAFFEKNDGVSQFMKEAYEAYGVMRFAGAPYMRQPQVDHHNRGEESIAAHMWAVGLLWEVTYPIMPHLTKIIDPEKVHRYVRIHDIGEIGDGDVSVVRQFNGEGKNRAQREEVVFSEISSLLPTESQIFIRQTHDQYEKEKNDYQTQNKEVLLAKMFDTLQGDHFVLTQGINFEDHSDIHKRIVIAKLLPFSKQLQKLLHDSDQIEAIEEVNLLIKHHLYLYQQKGISIESYLGEVTQ